MTRACDVLVAGLGPAGASAAAAAARIGLSVIALDSKKMIGIPAQSAEFVPLPPARSARGARAAFNGLTLRRDRLDRALANQADAAGARLWIDSALRWVDPAARSAQVSTANGVREIRYEVLVAADGASSAVAAALGLPRLALASTRQLTVNLPKPLPDTELWLSPRVPRGYAWLYPRGRVATLGVAFPQDADPCAADGLDELHGALLDARRIGDQILFRAAGSMPASGLRMRLVEDRVLFAGDAAGLAHPLTGAGAAAAVASGARAGVAAAEWLSGEPHALDAYEQDVRALFGPSIERGLAARRRLLAATPAPAVSGADPAGGWVAYPECFARDAN